MSFKEFLNKQTMASIPKKVRRVFPTTERYISVSSLGEHALNEFAPNKKGKHGVMDTFTEYGVDKGFDIFMDEAIDNYKAEPYSIPLLIIAVDCLGKDQCKKIMDGWK